MWIGLAQQIRGVDALSSEKYGIDSLSLMQNAATAVFDVIAEQTAPKQTVCILCGKGNNAGDGFALALLLQQQGRRVSVMTLCGYDFSADADYYYTRCKQNNICFCDTVPTADIYVDAVFGTGFHGELPARIAKVFSVVNQADAQRIAIDVPSGVNCDTGEISAHAFRADITVTFEILKYCHVLPDCREYVGQTFVKNIGLAPEAINDVGFSTQVLDTVSLPSRPDNAHKGSFGTVLCAVGSRNYQGAASLAVGAALRSGCGIVIGAVPQSVYLPVSVKHASAVIAPCDENENGSFSENAVIQIRQLCKSRVPTAILFGSGVGIHPDNQSISDYLASLGAPMVIDGDGLRYLPTLPTKDDLIITPHMGEFARLLECDIATLKSNRFALSMEYARAHNTTVVLKDAVTVISLPNGKQFVLNAPNGGLAKGGSGDVLAGMIASFAAQGFGTELAVKAGVYFHSRAGQVTTEKFGKISMLPSDLIDLLPKVLR